MKHSTAKARWCRRGRRLPRSPPRRDQKTAATFSHPDRRGLLILIDALHHALPPRPARMRTRLPARLRAPQPRRHHPLPQGLRRQPITMLLRQLLARERRPEVPVAFLNQLQHLAPHRRVDRVVRALATMSRHQTRRASVPVPRRQPLHLSNAQRQPLPPPRAASAASPPLAGSPRRDPPPACSTATPPSTRRPLVP